MKIIKTILAAVAIAGMTVAANAQCSGQFATGQFCGNDTGSTALPRATQLFNAPHTWPAVQSFTGNINAGPANITGSNYGVAINGPFSKTTPTGNANLALLSNNAIAANPLSMSLQVVGSATSNLRVGEIQVSEFGLATFHTLSLNPLGGNVSIGLPSGTAATAPLHVVGAVRFASFPAGILTTDSLGNISASTYINSVTAYGAICNGVADDTVAIAAAFTAAASNKGAVFFPPGTCLSGSQAGKLVSGIKVQGTGRASTLKALAGVAGTYLLSNPNLGTYTDTDIEIADLNIDGNNIGAGGTQTVFIGLVGLGRVTRPTMRNVKVFNYQYICAEIASSIDARIEDNEFTTCGYTGTTLEAGPALWMANVGGTDFSIGAIVERNNFHNLPWTGIYFNVNGGLLNNNVFRTVQETAILVARIPPNLLQKGSTISNNTIDGVTKHTISASCMEIAPYGTEITGNVITNCGHNGITMSDPHNVNIANNTVSNVNKQGDGAQGACFSLLSSLASPNQPQNIQYNGNRCYDDQGVVTTYTGMSLGFTLGGTTPATGISLIGDDFSGTTFVSGSAFLDPSSVFGTGSIRRNNLPLTINQALTVAEGGTNCTVASGTCLDNITGFSGTGFVSRAGGGVYSARVITGTAAEITVTNGDGVAGVPVLSLPTALTFTGKTVTGGTFAGGTYGNAITALTGDVTATGPGSVAATLATVNGNVGTFGSATQAVQVTFNAKGLATAAANITITPALGSITGLAANCATWLATPSSTNLAACVTDETGSGALVFGTSPTLTTAVAAGTWTASGTWTLPAHTLGGTISGGGNQINNVVIGTTTPLAGSFTTLSATTTITAGTNLGSTAGPLTIGNGTTVTTGVINGSGSGAGGGAYFSVQNNSAAVVAFGNRSALLGGTYDATGMVFSGGAIIVATNNTDAFEFFTDQTAGPVALATATANTLCYSTTAHSGFNTFSTCSSLRVLKDDIGPIRDAKNIVLALNPREYWSKPSEAREYGLYAEDVEGVAPLLATYYNGKLNGVDYMHLTAVLVAAMKEMQHEIDGLRARVR